MDYVLDANSAVVRNKINIVFHPSSLLKKRGLLLNAVSPQNIEIGREQEQEFECCTDTDAAAASQYFLSVVILVVTTRVWPGYSAFPFMLMFWCENGE